MNPYKILGVSQLAEYKTVRRKYIELAKKYHPDNFIYNNKVAEEKMKKINSAFHLIKESVHHQIIFFYHKGKFTQVEINEVILRYNKGQSLNKIAREMNRSRGAIRMHLIKQGYIAEPVKREKIQKNWYYVFIPNFHLCLFAFMTISMILSFTYMGLMCLALVCIISD